MISAASGLARWREEAAAAGGEVGRVRRALQEVARNVAHLVGGRGRGGQLPGCVATCTRA